jgi:hypothetical protein
VKTLLGLLIGAPIGWGARSLVAVLEETGHLPSVDEAMAILAPLWDSWDAA